MASRRRTAAAAAAAVLASLSLYPIFTGVTWFWAGCGAVAVAGLAGTATRVRRLPVAVGLAAGAVAQLLYLNLVFSNGRSLVHLLPTPASLAELGHVAAQGFSESSKYAPPVPELRGMVLLAAAGIGITALLTDLIAVRLGSAALAGLPLLLLFTEPFTLSVSRGFLGTTVAFCAGVAGYLALLSSEARDRIREWEHPDQVERDAPDTRALAAAGRRVGYASVALALCLPLLIPGLHVTRLFGGQPGIGGRAGHVAAPAAGFPDPTAQLSQELHQGQASTVLVYTSSAALPDYLQIYTLDKLTADKGWQLFAQPESQAEVRPDLPAAPGLTRTAGSTITTTHVNVSPTVTADALDALPVPYPALSVAASGDLRADRDTLMVFDSGVRLGGLKYTVTSRSADPAAEALGAAPRPAADIAQHYLQVPSSYDALRSLATSVVKAAGATNPYTEAVALQDWLAGGAFSYTLKAPSVLTAAGLARFLNVTRQGYCQQFSFAMAVLARLLGIPSRIAVGFTAGSPQNGGWVVTTHDAHAWPELYFEGYGWLRFEPTPAGSAGQGTASIPSYAQGALISPGSGQGQTAPAAGASGASGGGAAGLPIPPKLRNLLPAGDSGTATVSGSSVSPWEIAGLVVAGLLMMAAVAPWCARRVIRRRRWHRGRADQVRARDVAWAHAAWQELRDDLVDYGAGYQPSESPRAVAARAGDRLSLAGPARAALDRIALAEERARYAPSAADGSGLREDSAAVRQAIAAAVPAGVRWRARLLPPSVLGPALISVASAADQYRGVRGLRGVWPSSRPRGDGATARQHAR
jgi:transglutaminase-like putative cysteine protease